MPTLSRQWVLRQEGGRLANSQRSAVGGSLKAQPSGFPGQHPQPALRAVSPQAALSLTVFQLHPSALKGP